MKNDCLEAALHELAGIRNVEQTHGGKHLQLRAGTVATLSRSVASITVIGWYS
jgi:hypothetical protein